MANDGPVRVHVPTPLRSYTRAAEVDGRGPTLAAVLADVDARFPGLRFRIIDEQDAVRPHIKLFVRAEATRDLSTAVAPGDDVHIVCALSGG